MYDLYVGSSQTVFVPKNRIFPDSRTNESLEVVININVVGHRFIKLALTLYI